MDIGVPELLIILVIVVVIFGAGRIAKLGGELGTGIREFRKGLGGDEDSAATPDTKPEELIEVHDTKNT